ncbi:type ISP restriction/modification enzyme [Corallococcus interemptor]|uniref:type ISP restriction/modification enzyme n=1 Tax=Corallococcus interemptor TaxID=2316720 RepID=UPI003D006433
MLSKEEFVARILDGVAPTLKTTMKAASSSAFSADDVFGADEAAPASLATPPADTRFAQLLLVESGFGEGAEEPQDKIVLGDQRTARFLPPKAIYWKKATDRPFHIVLFELERKGSELFAGGLFRAPDQLEDALHRIVQDVLEGFERKRTADQQQGAQTETLCVVSVVDDRSSEIGRQIVCFGTKCVATDSMESFTLREEVRDWDRPLAEEHLEQLFQRHFRRLADGLKWQDAFVSGPEREKAKKLLEVCRNPDFLGQNTKRLKEAIFLLLDQLALSFGVGRTKQYKNQPASLEMEDLPPNHSIAVNPEVSRRKGFANPLNGVRVFDSSDRLLGYIVYVVDEKEDHQRLRKQLEEHNHFHNVLVIYPDENGGKLELWQGSRPLEGRLTRGSTRPRFDGIGGVVQLLSRFFIVSKSAIDNPEQLARELAWRAQHLKAIALDELTREISEEKGPLYRLFQNFNLALAQQEPKDFADTYAQTITYGMLAARWLARNKLTRFTRKEAMKLLPSTSEFLRDLFNRLINEEYDSNLTWLIDDITSLLSRTLVRDVFEGEQDPSIHFYQGFLDAYDPAIRRRMGVYYTPDEVVEYIVRSLDHLARTRLGLRLGLADPIRWGEYAKQRGMAKPAGAKDTDFVVQILDPATGTGTFLLHTLNLIFRTMTAEYARLGYDDVKAAAEWKKYVRDDLLPRINAFELMMAPYIVTHLRLGLALEQGLAEEAGHDPDKWGFTFGKKDRLRVFLTNTLALHTGHQLDWLSPHVAEEAREAEKLKLEAPILVVMGNPPYERISADADATAEWILKGKVPGRESNKSLFDDIRDVAREHTIFSHLRSLPDRYVYFWRWALWKVFEQQDAPGLLAFITNSTWLTGPGFVGLRKIVREQADELWSVDLGGDNSGTHPEANIFNIKTPVAITEMVRAGASASGASPNARYRKVVGGTAEEKLTSVANLAADSGDVSDQWKVAPTDWLDTLVPATGDATWQDLPALTDIFPWQQPGCLVSRTWPIAPDQATLSARWKKLVDSPVAARPELFATAKTGRNIHTKVPGYATLASLKSGAKHEPLVRYTLRSFDRQWVFEDPRLLKTESPSLWRSRSNRQIFLCSLLSVPIAKGPAVVVAATVPDFHHFRGSYGGKDVLPLYRDADASDPNVTKGLLEKISSLLGIKELTAGDLAAYVYAVLSAPQYQERFAEALKTPGPRLPLTRSAKLWSDAVELGKELLWLHTYTERFRSSANGRSSKLPKVAGLRWAKPVKEMPEKPSDVTYDEKNQQLVVGDGVVAGVRKDVMDYSVSGMEVVWKWLGYRTSRGAGRAASSSNPLDQIRATKWPNEWSDELIELLTVLTVTLDKHPAQGMLLDAICDGPLIPATELPTPSDAERKEPKAPKDPKASSTGKLL